MAFTSTDLANVETAITELAIGQRVTQITIAGKTVTYQATDLRKLYELRSLIQAELQTSKSFTNKAKFGNPL